MLFRLRSGHCGLKSFTGRWKHDDAGELNTNCDQEDCLQEREAPEHVLTSCPVYHTYRATLKEGLASLSIDFSTTNLLGLNYSIPKHAQVKIRDMLIPYLIETKLADRL